MKYFFVFHNKMRAASIAKNIARVGWLCIFSAMIASFIDRMKTQLETFKLFIFTFIYR